MSSSQVSPLYYQALSRNEMAISLDPGKGEVQTDYHPHHNLLIAVPLQLQQKGQDPAVPARRSSPKKSLHHCPQRRLQRDGSHLGKSVQDQQSRRQE
ncbi:hypothetical protein ACFX1Q_028099 [Malus domestica]